MKAKCLKVLGLAGSLFVAACATGPSGYDVYRITEDDLLILQTARSLLGEEDQWAHHEETQCDLGAVAWTLFCALQKASYDVLGEFQLRRPALEEVRVVVEQLAGQTFEKRLIDFNNRPETSFEDIQKALDIALGRIRARLPAS